MSLRLTSVIGRQITVATAILCVATAAFARPPDHPDTGAHLPSQAAADAIKEFAGTDAAFLAAGLVKDTYQKDNLASLLQYPTDEIVVVTLSGSQVRQAVERSLSLYPQPNTSFLQLSGFEVVFNPNAESGKRIVSMKAGGLSIDDSRNYTVAMPSSLGRGGLGYFKIWDKSKITRTVSKGNVEDALRGKKYVETSPRWVAQP